MSIDHMVIYYHLDSLLYSIFLITYNLIVIFCMPIKFFTLYLLILSNRWLLRLTLINNLLNICFLRNKLTFNLKGICLSIPFSNYPLLISKIILYKPNTFEKIINRILFSLISISSLLNSSHDC